MENRYTVAGYQKNPEALHLYVKDFRILTVKRTIGDERRKHGLPRNKTRTVMLNTADVQALKIAKYQVLTKYRVKAIDKISKNQAQESRPEHEVMIQELEITDKGATQDLNDAIHKLNNAIQKFNDIIQKDVIQKANVRKDKVKKPNSRSKSRSQDKTDRDITYGCPN